MNNQSGKLFPRLWDVVEALAKCCEIDKPVLSKSEVFNETWMLRLTLARIHDYYTEEFNVDEPKKSALGKIRKAVRKCWISEGGLEPAFKKEGTTWTDAILGDITIGEYDDGDGDKRKVKFECKDKGDSPLVIVIEAKMGSSLSKSVTNSPDYNQAARNIACLSKLLLEAEKGEGAFFVFMPDGQKHNLRPDNFSEAKNFISNAIKTIEDQNTDRPIESKRNGKPEIAKREYSFAEDKKKKFLGIVKSIIGSDNLKEKHSMVLTWDEIIDSMDDKTDNTSGIVSDTEKLRAFYKNALAEIKRK